jgi:hypothetical protein
MEVGAPAPIQQHAGRPRRVGRQLLVARIDSPIAGTTPRAPVSAAPLSCGVQFQNGVHRLAPGRLRGRHFLRGVPLGLRFGGHNPTAGASLVRTRPGTSRKLVLPGRGRGQRQARAWHGGIEGSTVRRRHRRPPVAHLPAGDRRRLAPWPESASRLGPLGATRQLVVASAWSVTTARQSLTGLPRGPTDRPAKEGPVVANPDRVRRQRLRIGLH